MTRKWPHLLSLLSQHLKERAGEDALFYKYNTRFESLTYQDLYTNVASFALSLQAEGISDGDKVAILSNNRPEWVVSDLAILSLRAVVVPIYPTLGAKDIQYILQHSESKIVVVETQEMLDKVLAIYEQCPQLSRIIFIHSNIAAIPDLCVPLTHLYKKGEKLLFKSPEQYVGLLSKIQRDDIASIVYTSGTTGFPKGVILTHGNFLSNIEDAISVLDFSQEDIALSFLPLSHVFERAGGYYLMLAVGAKIYYARSIETVVEDIQEAKPTVLISVPRLFEKIRAKILAQLKGVKKGLFTLGLYVGGKACLNKVHLEGEPYPFLFRFFQKLIFKKVAQKFGGRVRFFVSGGAPLAEPVFTFFESMGFPIIEGYGLTETAPVLAANRLDQVRKPGHVGLPFPSVEIKLADDGEVMAKGPNVSQGYYKDEHPEESPFQDGWFYTGDIGKIDEDGYLAIIDRKKELLVLSNGKNVAPQPVELALKDSAYITQAMLIGDQRSYVAALIVPDLEVLTQKFGLESKQIAFEDWVQTEEARAFFHKIVKEQVAEFSPYEQVKRFILLAKEFTLEANELTPTLKFKRRIIIENNKQVIDELYQ